jgi:hypothetical protein
MEESVLVIMVSDRDVRCALADIDIRVPLLYSYSGVRCPNLSMLYAKRQAKLQWLMQLRVMALARAEVIALGEAKSAQI